MSQVAASIVPGLPAVRLSKGNIFTRKGSLGLWIVHNGSPGHRAFIAHPNIPGGAVIDGALEVVLFEEVEAVLTPVRVVAMEA